MTTAQEREQILNEYGAWVEQKTLDGLDLSVEAYLEAVETEQYADRAKAIESMLLGEGANSPATFLTRSRAIFGIKEEINER